MLPIIDVGYFQYCSSTAVQITLFRSIGRSVILFSTHIIQMLSLDFSTPDQLMFDL